MTLLRARGFTVARMGAGPYLAAGTFDIEGCSPQGYFVAIEAKKEGRYRDPVDGLTPLQRKRFERLKEHPRAFVLVVDSLGAVEQALDARPDL